MPKHNQDGAVSGVALSLIMASVMLIATLIFAAWAYTSREDYKSNVQAKVKVAEEAARQKTSEAKDREFAEAAKNPLRTYTGPPSFGGLIVNYPKTWSGYVDDTGKGGGATIDAYFSPGEVPSVSDDNSVFALRVQILNQPYAETLEQLSSQQREGKLAIRAYALPKMPSIVGVALAGKVSGLSSNSEANTTMVVLPIRSQTLQIYTQGNQYLSDFNNIILPNVSFAP